MILEIEDSEFGDNGAGDGQSHNLYVGTIERFVVQGSYFHHGCCFRLPDSKLQTRKAQVLGFRAGRRLFSNLEFLK